MPSQAAQTADTFLPSPPIDLPHLRRQTFDDRALEAELLDLFSRQAKGILSDLMASASSTAAARQRRADLLHTLCGSARAVGAWDVAAGAERLEREERVASLSGPTGVDAPERLAALDRSVADACVAIDDLRARTG